MTVHPRTAAPAAALVLAALALAGFAGTPDAGEPGRPGDASATAIAIKAEPVTITPGGTAEAHVIVTLEPGFSMIGDPAPTKWVTPASLAVESSGGIIARIAKFPDSTLTQDPDGGPKYAIWKGSLDIRVPLQASVHAAEGDTVLHGRLRYQLSFENDFYTVAVRKVDIPVSIVPGKKAAGQAK